MWVTVNLSIAFIPYLAKGEFLLVKVKNLYKTFELMYPDGQIH